MGTASSKIYDSLNSDLGTYLELSSNGTVVALGGKNIIRVMKFDRVSDKWTQIGQNIASEMSDADVSISLSSEGTVVAVGFQNEVKKTKFVTVYEYKRELDMCEQLGQRLTQQFYVSTSADGMFLASSNIEGKGRVKIFQFVNNLNAWKELGFFWKVLSIWTSLVSHYLYLRMEGR